MLVVFGDVRKFRALRNEKLKEKYWFKGNFREFSFVEQIFTQYSSKSLTLINDNAYFDQISVDLTFKTNKLLSDRWINTQLCCPRLN